MNKNLNLNINIEEPAWIKALENIEQTSNLVLQEAFSHINQNEGIDFLEQDKPVYINLTLGNDAEIQELNRNYRGKDSATNVLSFANIDDENFFSDINMFEEVELGDIMIALETLQREAKEKNISLHNHYCHLLTHGILHLLGFDHLDDEEATTMENYEIEILKQINIDNPYKE